MVSSKELLPNASEPCTKHCPRLAKVAMHYSAIELHESHVISVGMSENPLQEFIDYIARDASKYDVFIGGSEQQRKDVAAELRSKAAKTLAEIGPIKDGWQHEAYRIVDGCSTEPLTMSFPGEAVIAVCMSNAEQLNYELADQD